MKPIKTAILGYGRSGSSLHADPIQALPDFDLVAVCDSEPAALKKAKDRFNCKTYNNYADMLKEEIDLVVIVTRSHQHSQMACDCLNAGKNVLVTKPWALNEREALNMINASEKSGRMLLPWLPARFAEDLTELKEIVASGIIGKIFMIRRSNFTIGVRNDWQTEKRCGGGYLLNWGPHLVDQPILLANEPVKNVYAVMKQVINPGDGEDVFFAVMNTENVTIISEFNYGASVIPDWVVQGDRGTITVKGNEVEVHAAGYPEKLDQAAYSSKVEVKITSGKKGRISSKNKYGDAELIYGRIAKAIRGTEPYPVTTGAALTLTRTLDAIRKSAETGAVVIPAK